MPLCLTVASSCLPGEPSIRSEHGEVKGNRTLSGETKCSISDSNTEPKSSTQMVSVAKVFLKGLVIFNCLMFWVPNASYLKGAWFSGSVEYLPSENWAPFKASHVGHPKTEAPKIASPF